MNFIALSEFARELKRLSKKYPSLERNFAESKLAIAQYPRGRSEKHWNRLYESDVVAIFKTRVACDSLKGDSLRIVYGYREREQRIDLIELYFKGDKENENRERIKDYLKKI